VITTVTNLGTISNHLKREVSNAPLVLFRIAFGVLMTASVIRFMLNGWVEEFYLKPTFHFTYYGFEWVQPLPEWAMYGLFGTMLISSVLIAIGAFYRLSISLFFLTFTYVELIDKTYYLNHYYFVSLMAFILIWLPAARRFSVDAMRKPNSRVNSCQFYEIAIIRLQVGIVYFFAGVAKLNSDWLFKAMPLKIWLPANSHLPVIGSLLTKTWVAYFFSWFGALYDLTVPFFLSMKRTRWVAYLSVISFHLLTAFLFPIGVFPYVMILSAIIFFPSELQEKWLQKLERWMSISPSFNGSGSYLNNWKFGVFTAFILLQLAMPWRYLMYPGSLFWHEQGYRFSWRVMLMEKMGQATFVVQDGGQKVIVDNRKHLTPLQEKMMATQPDMILQYAHYLEGVYELQGFNNPQVATEAYVTLNGRRSKQFIDEQVDLTEIEDSWKHKSWVLSYE